MKLMDIWTILEIQFNTFIRYASRLQIVSTACNSRAQIMQARKKVETKATRYLYQCISALELYHYVLCNCELAS